VYRGPASVSVCVDRSTCVPRPMVRMKLWISGSWRGSFLQRLMMFRMCLKLDFRRACMSACAWADMACVDRYVYILHRDTCVLRRNNGKKQFIVSINVYLQTNCLRSEVQHVPVVLAVVEEPDDVIDASLTLIFEGLHDLQRIVFEMVHVDLYSRHDMNSEHLRK